MRNDDESIPDRSRPGSPTTSGAARQRTWGNYDTAGLRENKKRKRGERRVKRQRELRKERRRHFIRDYTVLEHLIVAPLK